MSKVDIFSETQPVATAWASFKKVGDAVQGTYIGSRRAQDGFGHDQIIYELLNRDTNEVINVGMNLSKKLLHQRMQGVKLGQIVGFKYTSDKEILNRKTGTKATTKIIDLWADPRFVDQEWVDQNKHLVDAPRADYSAQTIAASEESEMDRRFNEMTEEKTEEDDGLFTEEMYADKIFEVAESKFGEMDKDDAKEKIMEVTNLPFIKSNYKEILNRLSLA
jgi:hypothetical protein